MDCPSADFDQTLTNAIAPWSLELTSSQIGQLRTHYAMMVETNRTMNLTRITDPREAAIKHYADSLALVACIAERGLVVRTILDVGTGAGFPAIPLAVFRPDWSITAIDGTRKKIDFVRRAAQSIDLKNLKCEHANSSHWKTRETFDLVTLRAVADPIAVAEAFVARGGFIVHFAGRPQEAKMPEGAGNVQSWNLDVHPYNLWVDEERIDRRLCLFGRTDKKAIR